MAQRIIAGAAVNLNEEGYLTDTSQWTEEIASEIALQEGILLTGKHYEVIYFMRARYKSGLVTSIRNIHKCGIIDLKTFYGLFPGAPLRKACKIGGLPKPESCV